MVSTIKLMMHHKEQFSLLFASWCYNRYLMMHHKVGLQGFTLSILMLQHKAFGTSNELLEYIVDFLMQSLGDFTDQKTIFFFMMNTLFDVAYNFSSYYYLNTVRDGQLLRSSLFHFDFIFLQKNLVFHIPYVDFYMYIYIYTCLIVQRIQALNGYKQRNLQPLHQLKPLYLLQQWCHQV